MNCESKDKDYRKYISNQIQSVLKQMNANPVSFDITDNSFCLEKWKQPFLETLERKLKETQVPFKEGKLHKLFCDETIEEIQDFLIQRKEDNTIDIKQLTPDCVRLLIQKFEDYLA